MNQRDIPGDDDSAVTVADDIFGPNTDWRTAMDADEPGTAFTVLSDQPELVAQVLQDLIPTLLQVADDGQVLDEEDAYTSELYTPNHVHPVRVFDGGAFVLMDTKGELIPPMARTMLRIIVEELERLQVHAHIVPFDPAHQDLADRLRQPTAWSRGSFTSDGRMGLDQR